MSTKSTRTSTQATAKRRRAEVSDDIETLLRKLIRQLGPVSAVPKKTPPHFVVQNDGWNAKYQSGEEEVDLVPFPMWAIWFVKDKEDDRIVPKVEPMIPMDDEGNFDWGSELVGYIGFEEPTDTTDPELDDLDDDDPESLDGDDDDDPESLDGDDDDDDNPIDQMDGGDQNVDDEPADVIDTEGEEVQEE